MDDEPKAIEVEPRKRQITLGMIFGVIVFFAAALIADGIGSPLDPNIYPLLVLSPVIAIANAIIMTKGAAAYGAACGFCVGLVLLGIPAARGQYDGVPASVMFVGSSAWIGAAIGAASRGHRFVAWVAFVSAGLCLVLAAT